MVPNNGKSAMNEITSDSGRMWERLPGETAKQFDWFKVYRNLSAIDRTVAEAYRRKTGKLDAIKAPSWIYEMSSKYRWRDRSTAFDTYLDRLQYEAEVDERIRARKLRRAVLAAAMKRTGEAIPRVDLSSMSGGDLARLLDVTAKQLREEYADIPEHRQTVTVVNGGTSGHVALAERAESMTDDELVAEYRRMTAGAIASRPLADGEASIGEDDDANS